MFFRISSLVVVAMPLLAAATALPRDDTGNCNTGPIQCCNQVQSASTTALASLAGLLGISLGSITGLVGLSCSPISVAGIGGNSCSAQPVCCTNNSFSGVLALGCSPINLNL
ncbi:fungal hydrophobin-domain-containing protein [Infundibulicybe gibba]|nr:fungal hydrophobin-domain-containing protein [Infundibulicybe gibba]